MTLRKTYDVTLKGSSLFDEVTIDLKFRVLYGADLRDATIKKVTQHLGVSDVTIHWSSHVTMYRQDCRVVWFAEDRFHDIHCIMQRSCDHMNLRWTEGVRMCHGCSEKFHCFQSTSPLYSKDGTNVTVAVPLDQHNGIIGDGVVI